jgi:hypothetical protein
MNRVERVVARLEHRAGHASRFGSEGPRLRDHGISTSLTRVTVVRAAT